MSVWKIVPLDEYGGDLSDGTELPADITSLTLGELLVLRIPHRITGEEARELGERWKALYAGMPPIILDGGAELVRLVQVDDPREVPG